jgi:hypothetical protein
MQWLCPKMLIIVGREDSTDSIKMDGSLAQEITNMTEGDTAFYKPFLYRSL